MRKSFVKALCEEAVKNPRIFLITGDLGFNVLEPFRDKFPDRFLNIGVAEANLVTVAAGLSTTGFIPFIYSIATFMTMRPFEQIRNDISLQNLNVKIIGVGGGLTYTKAGPTHHSVEDIALMRLMPNMVIIVPCDLNMAFQATKEIAKYKGPVYMRLERNPEDSIYTRQSTFRIGKGKMLVRGKGIAIFVTGTKIDMALKVASILKGKKLYPSIFSFPTIQPLDKKLLFKIAKNHSLLVTIEEHRTESGFGSAVGEFMLERGFNNLQLIKFGLRNTFSETSGSYDAMLKLNDFTTQAVVRSIYTRVRKNFLN